MMEQQINFTKLSDSLEGFTVDAGGVAVPKFNQKTKLYKLFATNSKIQLFNANGFIQTVAANSIQKAGIIMMLALNTGEGNILTKRYGGDRYLPIRTEKELAELAGRQIRTFYRQSKFLYDEGIIKKAIKQNEKVYYMNPLAALHYKGLSLECYKLFKEYIQPFLSSRDVYTLEKYSKDITDFSTVKD